MIEKLYIAMHAIISTSALPSLSPPRSQTHIRPGPDQHTPP